MSHLNETCAVCGVGILESRETTRLIEGQGLSINVSGLLSQVCPVCGIEQAGPHELRHNKRLIVEARKRAKGLLTGTEVRQIRESLGMTQAIAASCFGGGANAFSKYETETLEQSIPMDRALRMAQQIHEMTHLLFVMPYAGSLNVVVSKFENGSLFTSTASDDSQKSISVRLGKELQDYDKYKATSR